jgi:hypothetical protein
VIARTFDATFLNTVANNEDVRPWLAGFGALDISAIVGNANNFALQSEFGGFVFTRFEAGRYEAHSMFLKGHGTHAIRAMRAAVEWMFTRTDCEIILTKVPKNNLAAKGLGIAGGFKTMFERDDAALGPCDYISLTISDWALSSRDMEKHGVRLHDFFDTASKAAGVEWGEHPVDAVHDRAAGAALVMGERGQAAKGTLFYNRWASFAGYPTINLVSASPVVLDMSAGHATCVVGISEKDLEMLLCR